MPDLPVPNASRAQRGIPCTLMRGGSSKGPFFLASDLPSEPERRDRVLLSVMGSPDARQIDGLGGAHPLTSKVAIVARSTRPGIDVDFTFAQVGIDRPLVDLGPNCGNMLAGVGPFAIEQGLVEGRDPETPVRIYLVNGGNKATAHVPTPGGFVCYEGSSAIGGVPGTAAAIRIDFLETAGSLCGALLPTGRAKDSIAGVEVTLIDNGMPVVLLRAADLGKSGYERPDELDSDVELKTKLEAVRLWAGERMGLGDVRTRVVPKLTLLAAPRSGGQVCTRTFIPHQCHTAIGVLGAVTVATACVLPGSVAADLVQVAPGSVQRLSVEHPTGEFTLELELAPPPEPFRVVRSSLVRTARALFRGHAFVPNGVWSGV